MSGKPMVEIVGNVVGEDVPHHKGDTDEPQLFEVFGVLEGAE